MEKFSSDLSCQGGKECARVIAQRAVAAGGAEAGLMLRMLPASCLAVRGALGHGDPVAISWLSRMLKIELNKSLQCPSGNEQQKLCLWGIAAGWKGNVFSHGWQSRGCSAGVGCTLAGLKSTNSLCGFHLNGLKLLQS